MGMRLFLQAVRPSTRLADVESEFRTFLATSTARVLVFTGGSSTSGVDLVRKVLNDMGATYLFESVDVRPGHPALAARLQVPETGPNSGRERFVLGLPGNRWQHTRLCIRICHRFWWYEGHVPTGAGFGCFG